MSIYCKFRSHLLPDSSLHAKRTSLRLASRAATKHVALGGMQSHPLINFPTQEILVYGDSLVTLRGQIANVSTEGAAFSSPLDSRTLDSESTLLPCHACLCGGRSSRALRSRASPSLVGLRGVGQGREDPTSVCLTQHLGTESPGRNEATQNWDPFASCTSRRVCASAGTQSLSCARTLMRDSAPLTRPLGPLCQSQSSQTP